MCNLYSLTKGQAAIRDWFRASNDRTGNLPRFPGIFPDQMAPIVRNGVDGERELVMARWGMPGPQQFGGAPITNIRNVSSPHWRGWLSIAMASGSARSRSFQPVRCTTDRSEFVWIGLFEPSEAELRQLQENYDLHPLAIEDALVAHQLPKLDIYGDQLFVVARPAHLADGQIYYGETSVFVGDTFIISVRHGSERAHSGLRQQLESSSRAAPARCRLRCFTPFSTLVHGYLPIVEAIEEEVLEIEQRTLEALEGQVGGQRPGLKMSARIVRKLDPGHIEEVANGIQAMGFSAPALVGKAIIDRRPASRPLRTSP